LRTEDGAADTSYSIGNAEEALDALTRHMDQPVALIDLDGCVLRWNAASEAALGWQAGEVLGRKLPHVPHDLQRRFLTELRAIADAGRVVEREVEAVRADGMRVALRLVFIPVKDGDGHVFGALTIGNQIASDGRLGVQRDDLTSLVAQRLRDPITAILGAAQLLLRPEIADDPERRARTAATIVGGAQVATAIVESLSIAAAAESTPELEMAPVDLATLVHEIVAGLPEDDHVIVDFDPSLGAVRADRRRLQLVLGHLIATALRHSPPGLSVEVSVYARGNEAVIAVCDHGPSVEPRERERIFDRYYRGEDLRAAADGGVGLFVVQSVARAHGGSVSVVNSPSGGTEFVFTLPLDRSGTALEGNDDGSARGA